MTALIVVDVQNDFLPEGALAVADGNEIIPIINKLLKCTFDVKVATKDWHPANHGSFAATHHKQPGEHVLLRGIDQILWPVHCVQGTSGAEFAPSLDVQNIQHTFHKGTEIDIDSYSAFFDNEHLKRTELFDFLKEKGIKDVYFAGLATDYCVKYSVLDALMLKLNVFVIADACRAVNLQKNDGLQAIEEMRSFGAHIIQTSQIPQYL